MGKDHRHRSGQAVIGDFEATDGAPLVIDETNGIVYLKDENENILPVGSNLPDATIGDVSGGDYLEVEADGTLVLHGDATTFDDLLNMLIGQKLESPSSKITIDGAEGSLVFADSATLSDYVVMNVQMPHKWKIGSVVYPHIHWWQASASIPNWLMQYRWQDQGAAKTTAWTSVKWVSHAFTYVSGTLNQITAFGGLTPPANAGLSDIVQFRLIRDTANTSTLFSGADPLTGDANAVNFDIHVESDTLGSNEEYTK
jgi:hypothetical protein